MTAGYTIHRAAGCPLLESVAARRVVMLPTAWGPVGWGSVVGVIVVSASEATVDRPIACESKQKKNATQ